MTTITLATFQASLKLPAGVRLPGLPEPARGFPAGARVRWA